LIWLTPSRRVAFQRFVFPLLVVLSVLLIILGKADQLAFESLRVPIADAAAPLLDALSRPVGAIESLGDRASSIFDVYQRNARLTEENEQLLHWQQAARALAAENAQLRGLLKLAPEASTSYVTARVIANTGGAFARSLMIDAGSASGIARGQAAITGEGLVGRVLEVGRRAARVLLVTDLNSRVPVFVGDLHQRAVLAGDNSERPCLRYLEAAATVKIGDRVVTSGEGGVFPPGLPIGVVATVDGGLPRIEPYADASRAEYLRVVDYGLADGLPAPVRPAPHRRPASVAERRG
jgi:rod shape-determining protein MreC